MHSDVEEVVSHNKPEKHTSIIEQYIPVFSALLGNRIVLAALILTAILGYGFKITSVSIGIDDSAYLRYFHRPALEIVAQHRGIFLLYDKIIGMQYMPFWLDCLSVIIFIIGSVCWAILFQRVSNNRIGIIPLTVFMTALLSFPIINTIFIYNGANFAVCLGYLLTAIAMIFTTAQVLYHGKTYYYLIAFIVLTIAISPYESTASVYLCGIFAVLFFHYWYNNQRNLLVDYLKYMLKYLAVLFLAVIGKYLFSESIRHLLGIQKSGVAEINIEWLAQGTIAEKIYHFFHDILGNIYINSIIRAQFWAIELLIIIGILFLCAIITAIIKKSGIPLYLLLLLIASVFSMSIIQGKFAPERICQSYAFIVAFTLLLLLILFQKYILAYKALIVTILFIILAQTHDLNFWFYNNYQRYQNDRRTIEQLAWELQRSYNCNKPIAFIGSVNWNHKNNIMICGTNGYSIVTWGVGAFGENSTELLNIFKMHGITLQQASDSQMKFARNATQHMPAWPKAGSIREFSEIIVVKFSDIQIQ